MSPAASCDFPEELLNRGRISCIVCNQGIAKKQLSIAADVIPVEKNRNLNCNEANELYSFQLWVSNV